MFANIIYIIVALLIYNTYQPSQTPRLAPLETVVSCFALLVVFAYLSHRQFKRIENAPFSVSAARRDHAFSSTLTRQSVLALMVYAVDIHLLDLPGLLFFQRIGSLWPTFEAVVFLTLFLGYLVIVWASAHGAHGSIYGSDISLKDYVRSNISLSLPVILPWFVLSCMVDLINVMPLGKTKEMLSAPEGQFLFFAVFLCGVAIVAPLMIQKFWRCTPLEEGSHRRRIEKMCSKADLKYAEILRWPLFGGKMITAGVMGLVGKFRYLLVTGALLQHLEPEEIDAVIAHEIGHIRKKHLLFYLFLLSGYMLFVFATFEFLAFLILFSTPVVKLVSITGIRQEMVASFLWSVVPIVFFLVYFRYVFGYFIRNFEREADIYVYQLLENAQTLISSLKKIAYISGQPPDKPNWHHFSIRERVVYLQKCEADRSWITRHERKIKTSLIVYLGVLLIMGISGYQLNYGKTGELLNNHFIEEALLRQIEETPDNPELHTLLGDIYFRAKNYSGLVEAYQRALDLSPDNPHVLNNLAWFYATCEQTSLRDPEKALMLAQKAARLQKSPHILDTLAESYFINAMYGEAIQAEKSALAQATQNREYYRKQLRKFENALENDSLPKS